MTSIAITSLEQAAELKAKARKLEREAAAIDKAARDYIASHAPKSVDERDGSWYLDPNGTKTLLYETPSGTISITYPESAGLPARLDVSRWEDIQEKFRELGLQELFERCFRPTGFRFLEDVFLNEVREGRAAHDLLEEFILPAEGPKPLTPRISVK
jgi:hypothetical protein